MSTITIMEYEVKIRVSDLGSIEKKLVSSGWVLEDVLLEEDRYVDLTHCVGSPARQIALRVRIKKSLARNTSAAELTFKGALVEEGVKAREEITTTLEDPEKITRILLLSGFPIITVRKKRRVYSTAENRVKIYLDEVEGLGSYVEVELINPESREEYLRILNKIKDELGLSKEENIIKSYLELKMEAWRA
ncbi:MAG: class IV adenylate cyclase [Zestosphaera sp.]